MGVDDPVHDHPALSVRASAHAAEAQPADPMQVPARQNRGADNDYADRGRAMMRRRDVPRRRACATSMPRYRYIEREEARLRGIAGSHCIIPSHHVLSQHCYARRFRTPLPAAAKVLICGRSLSRHLDVPFVSGRRVCVSGIGAQDGTGNACCTLYSFRLEADNQKLLAAGRSGRGGSLYETCRVRGLGS